jgi:tellurite resistance protein TehA-like permease
VLLLGLLVSPCRHPKRLATCNLADPPLGEYPTVPDVNYNLQRKTYFSSTLTNKPTIRLNMPPNHDHERPASKLPISERLKHFTWSWFECTMSTGALATLIGQQPYTFPGLKTIGATVFVIDIVLFVVFCGCITYRFTRNRNVLSKSLHHPHESFYFGTFWVSIALILYCVQQYGVSSTGPWLTKAFEISFWTYVGCVFLVAVFQYHVIFDEEKLSVSEAMPSWILPVYPFLILGPLAAELVKGQVQTRALPILLGGLCFQGLGWCVAFIMYTLYVTRLIGSEIPEPSKKPGMYVAVGPAGMFITLLVELMTDCVQHTPQTRS